MSHSAWRRSATGQTRQPVISARCEARRDNSDQGIRFTSVAFTGVLSAAGIRISMHGRGR